MSVDFVSVKVVIKESYLLTYLLISASVTCSVVYSIKMEVGAN